MNIKLNILTLLYERKVALHHLSSSPRVEHQKALRSSESKDDQI